MQPEAKKARYARRKQQVIEAAARVFAERGYHGASTKAIAAELGIQQGSLYHYLASKEEALEAVCYEGTAGFVRGIERILESDAPFPARLRAAVANHLRPFAERRDFVVVFLNERHHLPAARRRAIRRISRRYEELVEALFEAAHRHGELRGDLAPRLAALALIGLCNSTCSWLERPGMAPLEQVIDRYAALLADGLARR